MTDMSALFSVGPRSRWNNARRWFMSHLWGHGHKHVTHVFFSKGPRVTPTASRPGPSTSGKADGSENSSEADVSTEQASVGAEFQSEADAKMAAVFFPGSQKHWAWVNSFTLSWILAARWFVSGRWAWRYVAFSPSAFLPESTWGIDKSWKALFWARKGYTNSSVLTTLDGGPARGYVEVSQLERAIAVHLCSLNIAIWRGHPRLSSRAYSYGFIHQPPGWCSLPSEM